MFELADEVVISVKSKFYKEEHTFGHGLITDIGCFDSDGEEIYKEDAEDNGTVTYKYKVYFESQGRSTLVYNECDLELAVQKDLETKCIECATPLTIKLSDKDVYAKFKIKEIFFKMCPACLENWKKIRSVKI